MTDLNRLRIMVSAATILIAASSVTSAAAAETSSLADALSLDPPQWNIGDVSIKLGGFAAGAAFDAHQSGGPAHSAYNHQDVSAEARTNLRAQRIFDTGLILGAGADFLLYRDKFSSDQYDNDTVEKIFLFLQTGFGRVEVGEQDGAGYTLGLSGPVTNEDVTLENRNISLFRDPITGNDFGSRFQAVTTVQSTSNFAKIVYTSPRLFGLQVGASFTPQMVRSPLPFTGNPTSDPNQQEDIWEIAANYTTYVSNVAVGLSAALARGSLKNRTIGTDDLYDWALGAQLAYTLSDVKLSLGGAYRDSNAFGFNPGQALRHGGSHSAHISTTAEWDSWVAGLEYSRSEATGAPDLDVTGYQVSGGYKLNDNLQITAGWQWYDYRRNLGTFYNGAPKIDMNAAFLLLSYQL
jgi:predicted porin